MKKILSILLAISVVVSSLPTVFAYRDGEIPEIESGYTITYPEPADVGITENENVFSEDEQTDSYDYARLVNIVHKQNGADEEFLNYYDNTYVMSVDEMLSYYFTAEEISALYTVNEKYDCNIIMKLLVCFFESDLLTNEEKQAIIAELNNEVEIYYILKLFNDYMVLDSDIKEQLDNSFIVYYQTVRSRTEVYSDYTEEIENFALENKYYTKQGTNLYIDDDSGNLQYKRTDASIPVRNGLNMELAVKYDLQEAYFDYYTKFSNGYKEDPLGCGWLFDITYTNENIINLSDGRSIVISGNSTKNNHYADVDYLYDEDEGKYYVAYRDGTREYFATAVSYSFQYICKKVDKYGNTIYYDIDTADKKKINRIYNNINDLDIRISYETDKTTATMPDNNKVIYYKEAVTYEYGKPENKSYTYKASVLTSIRSNDIEGARAYFEYELLDCCVYEGIVTDKYGDDAVESDSKAFATMICAGENPVGERHKMSYITRIGDRGSVFMPVVHTYLPEYSNADPQKTYSYTYNNGWNRTVTINYENDMRRTIYISSQKRQSDFYKKSGNSYVLVQRDTSEFSQYYSHIPDSIETVVYNDSGNSITKLYTYEYNDDQQPTSCVYTIDGNEVSTTSYTYFNNAYKSLMDVDLTYDGDLFKYTAYSVNAFGDVTHESTAGANAADMRKTEYTYDANHNVIKTQIKDEEENVYYVQTMEYSDTYDNAVLTKQTNGNGCNTTTYEYNPLNLKVTSITDGSGNSERLEYDSYGRVKKKIHPDNTYTNITYWDVDSSIDVTDENGYMQTYWYNHGQTAKLTEGENYETTLATVNIDSYGRPVSKSDALGNTTTVEYDVLDRQSKVTYPAIGTNSAGSVQVKYYDVFLEGSEKYSMRMTISQENAISLEYYDTRGRLVKTAMVNNPSTLLAYEDIDTMNQLPTDTQLIVTGTYTYDNWDRLVRQADGVGRTTSYTYDIHGNVLCVTQGNGGEIYTVYYEYDPTGNVTKMTQGDHVTTYEYNLAGQLVKMTDPMGYTETYTYNTVGNVATFKDKNGVTTTYIYDTRNRLKSKHKSGKSESYTYDSVGNILTQTNENGTITLEYNLNGTLKKKTMPDGKSISYTYDMVKNVTSMTDYFGQTSTYTYTGGNYIDTVTTPYGNLCYDYRKDGSIDQTYNGNNSVIYSYDKMGRLSFFFPSDGYAVAYAYDNSGNIIGKNDLGTEYTTYTYDNVNRLVSEEKGNLTYYYSYDRYNNMTCSITNTDNSYTYDANNRLVSMNLQGQVIDGIMYDYQYHYSYDNNGNMTAADYTYDKYNMQTATYIAENCIDYSEYSYDVWDRMIYSYSIDDPDNIEYNITYSYYADGTRTSKNVRRRDVYANQTVNNVYNYYYNGDTVINETKNGTNYATNLIGRTGIEGRNQNGTTGFFVKDMHGDVRGAYTSTGTELANYLYTAWGGESETSTSDWAVENPIRYNGQYLDNETGFYYLRARYYDPSISRFTSEDPAEDGLNWYAYCGNNPVMFSDPSGYITEEEMNMYENGQMAPMAYSYLMNLTYQWYLTDEQSSKEYYQQLADDFRKTGYTTTNGLFRNVDEGIAFMDKKPNGWSGAISLTEKEHLFRNKLNLNFSWTDFQKLNERLPDDMKWTKVIATLHQNNIVNNKENIKYVSADGHFEVIYNGNNELLTGINNPQDMGTYNYCSPIIDATGHTYYDILPYLQYGNI